MRSLLTDDLLFWNPYKILILPYFITFNTWTYFLVFVKSKVLKQICKYKMVEVIQKIDYMSIFFYLLD